MADVGMDGLLGAYILDGAGGAKEIGWEEINRWNPGAGFLWLHLDRKASGTSEWMGARSGLDPGVCEALLVDDTRPRCLRLGEAQLVILRGVNLNPGADPEDMVSLRLWTDRDRAITLRGQKVMAIQNIREKLHAGTGPKGPSDLLVAIAGGLTDLVSPVLESLEDEVDEMEEALLERQTPEIRSRLSTLRRQTIAIRRYLAPQREAMTRMSLEPPGWLSEADRARLRESADRITRCVEDLDSLRDRAAVTHEELSTRLQDQMNRTMYVLSLVATLFLPLGFLTGLLGINVGGIPGTESSVAFVVVCVGLLVVGLLEFSYLYHRRLF